jgi:hypothetical protein
MGDKSPCRYDCEKVYGSQQIFNVLSDYLKKLKSRPRLSLQSQSFTIAYDK